MKRVFDIKDLMVFENLYEFINDSTLEGLFMSSFYYKVQQEKI